MKAPVGDSEAWLARAPKEEESVDEGELIRLAERESGSGCLRPAAASN